MEINSLSGSYNRSKMRSLEILSVFKLMNHNPKRILDFGYGEGKITNFLHRKGLNIIGLDVTKGNYENASKSFPECDFRLYDGLNIPFEKNSFDTIILNDVMEHIPYDEMERIIDGLRNIVKPKGIIYISVSNRFAIIEPHTEMAFITWFPRVFWKSIEKTFRKPNDKLIYSISNIYPYTFKRLKSFCLRHNLIFKDFTSVYVSHKFMNLEYIGNNFMRKGVKFLKKIRSLNLFIHLACKCSEIVCIGIV